MGNEMGRGVQFSTDNSFCTEQRKLVMQYLDSIA